jgi:hypothetical protein
MTVTRYLGSYHLFDDRGNAANGIGGAQGFGADAIDPGGNFLGRAGGLAGEVLDLVRDDGEVFARFPGAGCLDRGVQRQQVGLFGDFTDQDHHVADALGDPDKAFQVVADTVRAIG